MCMYLYKDQLLALTSTIIMMLAPTDESPCVLTTAELDDSRVLLHLNAPSSPTHCFLSTSPSRSLSHMHVRERGRTLFELW